MSTLSSVLRSTGAHLSFLASPHTNARALPPPPPLFPHLLRGADPERRFAPQFAVEVTFWRDVRFLRRRRLLMETAKWMHARTHARTCFEVAAATNATTFSRPFLLEKQCLCVLYTASTGRRRPARRAGFSVTTPPSWRRGTSATSRGARGRSAASNRSGAETMTTVTNCFSMDLMLLAASLVFAIGESRPRLFLRRQENFPDRTFA